MTHQSSGVWLVVSNEVPLTIRYLQGVPKRGSSTIWEAATNTAAFCIECNNQKSLKDYQGQGITLGSLNITLYRYGEAQGRVFPWTWNIQTIQNISGPAKEQLSWWRITLYGVLLVKSQNEHFGRALGSDSDCTTFGFKCMRHVCAFKFDVYFDL